MNRKIRIISIVLCLLSIPLYALEKNTLWGEKINSQIEFQNKLANLLLREIPEAEEIVIIQRDFQITMIEMRSEEYYFLREHMPSRIIRNQGTSRWSNFEWTDEDNKKILMLNENYRNLKQKKELLEKKNQGHPMWPLVRDKFSKIRETPEYREIYKRLMGTLEEIELKLKNTN
jgi:hypothetical protein